MATTDLAAATVPFAFPSSDPITKCKVDSTSTDAQLGRTSASMIRRMVRRGENQIVRQGRGLGRSMIASFKAAGV